MLRIGLTGGIGAGKSTVSATFDECGGIIVDGDVIAREVVEPGTDGLEALVDAFGEDILLPDGALNRPALAAKAFVDEEQRAKLNSIVHPLVGARRSEIIESVPDDVVVVEDIPLLVETGMAPMFPVVWSPSPEETRVERLIKRGMDETDARARIAAQASEDQRRAIADVLLDNSGSQHDLTQRARDLWQQRVLPLADNMPPQPGRRLAVNWCRTTRNGRAKRNGSSASKWPAGTGIAGRPHRLHGRTRSRGQGRDRHPGHRRLA